MTRSDFILDEDIVSLFETAATDDDGDCFVTSNFAFLDDDIEACERVEWRVRGHHVLNGHVCDYGEIDSGVWLMRRETFDRVGGLNEKLTAWGHAQTEFQFRVHAAGVRFLRVNDVLFRHPMHRGERDLALANRQLRQVIGSDIRELWARYAGASPY